MSSTKSLRPDRILAVVDEIKKFSKKYPTASLTNFDLHFKTTKAYNNLNAFEKKEIWKDGDVLEALEPVIKNNNGNVTNIIKKLMGDEDMHTQNENKDFVGTTGTDNSVNITDYIKAETQQAEAAANKKDADPATVKFNKSGESNKPVVNKVTDREAKNDAADTSNGEEGNPYLFSKRRFASDGPMRIDVKMNKNSKELKGTELVYHPEFLAELKDLLKTEKYNVFKIYKMFKDRPVDLSADDIANMKDAKLVGTLTMVAAMASKYNIEEELVPQHIVKVLTDAGLIKKDKVAKPQTAAAQAKVDDKTDVPVVENSTANTEKAKGQKALVAEKSIEASKPVEATANKEEKLEAAKPVVEQKRSNEPITNIFEHTSNRMRAALLGFLPT